MAQACLATLLRLDEHTGDNNTKLSPLIKYAAEHWVEHARFENVSSRVRDGMDDLFDSSKPHFTAWLQVHNIDKGWSSPYSQDGTGSPLYYAAFCGFYDVAECLITKYPEQVNERGGLNLFPLRAALYKKHLHVANLLFRHNAIVDIRGSENYTPLHAVSVYGQVDVIRWLLDRGADANARGDYHLTPLFEAVNTMHLEAVQVLLEHNADINSQDSDDITPLYWILSYCSSKEKFDDMVHQLLEHGANPNICTNSHKAPLHQASSRGLLEAARLLLRYGAKVDVKDKKGKTPLQLAESDEMMKLLLEHGAVLRAPLLGCPRVRVGAMPGEERDPAHGAGD